MKDGLENCGAVTEYEEDFRDIDEHIADASHLQQLSKPKDDDNIKITTLSETLSLVQAADSCTTGTSRDEEDYDGDDGPTASSESCDCDVKVNNGVAPSPSDERVEVMYFDHTPPQDNNKPPPNVDIIYDAHNEKLRKKDAAVTSSPVNNVGFNDVPSTNNGSGFTDPLFSSHMYDEVKSDLVKCEGELNGVGDGGPESPSPPPPILVDPLTSFQIDLHDDTF